MAKDHEQPKQQHHEPQQEQRAAQKTVVVLRDNDRIRTAIAAMIDNGISCVLVEDRHQKICGIVTERDIVRRLTLAEKSDKLDSMVRAIMSFPVQCVAPTAIMDSLKPLLYHQRLRHFPIATSAEPTTDEVLGIVTVTDLAKLYIASLDKARERVDVALIASGGPYAQQVEDILTNLGHEVLSAGEWQQAGFPTTAVVVDLDDPIMQDKALINRVLAYRHTAVFLTGKAERYAPICEKLKAPNQHVLLKPVDFTVLALLLTHPEGAVPAPRAVG